MFQLTTWVEKDGEMCIRDRLKPFLKRFDSIMFMEKGKIVAKDKYELLLETCDNSNDFLIYTATDGGNHHEYNITSLSFE